MTNYYEIAHSPTILDLQEQKGSRRLYTEATGTGPLGHRQHDRERALRSDGAVIVEVLATSWNCPKYITPRFAEEEVRGAIDVLQARIFELEARLADM